MFTFPANTIFILDGSWMIHRAYHVAEKSDVSAVYVFARMMVKFIEDLKPKHLIVTRDCESSTAYRRRIYPGYKQKEPKPQEFLEQEKLCDEVLRVMKTQLVVYPDYEADDIMATFARKLSEDAHNFTCLVSQDKDLLQCVRTNVVVYDPMRDRVLDAAGMRQEKGFWPSQSVDIQALTGDATDGVPGIHGVGNQTAIRLVRTYGSALEVFDHLDDLTPGLRNKLTGCKAQVELALKLVKLVDDLNGSTQPLEEFVINEAWCKEVGALFKKLKFNQRAIGQLYLMVERSKK